MEHNTVESEIDDILKSRVTHQGKWKVSDEIIIDCYVTNKKKRLMSLRGTGRAMNLRGGGSTALHRVLKAKWIQPYLTDQLKSWINRASETKFSKMKPLYGPHYFIPFEATLFVDVCKAYIDADNAGVLTAQQKITSDRLLGIMTAFAKVGIVALVDEITGYQEERGDTDLQKFFKLYVSDEHSPWTKRFPDEFYEHMCRLKGWGPFLKYGRKMPQVAGKYTNDLIYKYLPKGVLEMLKERTPKSEAGNNTRRYHQNLTPKQGIQHLLGHMGTVVALMKVSNTWDDFLYIFDVNFNNVRQQRFTLTY